MNFLIAKPKREAWKIIYDFNVVWSRDLAILVQHSNQLSHETTDIGSWSFVGSNAHVRNESKMKMISEIDHIFFRLLYAIAKIVFTTARIIASLDFIAAVQCMTYLIYHFIIKTKKVSCFCSCIGCNFGPQLAYFASIAINAISAAITNFSGNIFCL